MSSDVFMIRNGDGAEVGPCSGQTIAVLISEGVITADACVISDSGLLPITQVPTFAKALGKVDDASPASVLATKLFTSDLVAMDGAEPLELNDLEDPIERSETLSVDLPGSTTSGTLEEVLGPEHTIVDPWFAGVLIELWRRSETVVLEVEANDVLTTIYMLEGTPMFASNGTLTDTLGRLLIRMGRITEDQLEQAIEHFIENYEGTNKRVGEVLIELDMVTPEQISEALHIQTREKILSCFQWTHLRYSIKRDPESVKRMPRFSCPVPYLLEDGIRRYYDEGRIDQVVEGLAHCYPGVEIARDRVAELLAGDPEHQQLEMPDDDDEGALADAFDVPPKDRSNAAVRSLWAEASYKMGKRLMYHRPAAAIGKLKRAVKLRPEALEYRMLLTYIEYRTSKDADTRAEKAKEARAFAEQALQQDRKAASAHTILGHFDKLVGNLGGAIEHFRRALELDPTDREAKQEFRLLRSDSTPDTPRPR